MTETSAPPGGYLTWDRPVHGGVYIDPRGEVYDDQFVSDYVARLTQPSRWQDEADRRGFQTVFLFHWWHRTLLNWLIRDGRWALVYFDENATVFVRRAGNEALIEQALRAFEPLRERNVQALLAPATSWRGRWARREGFWPTGCCSTRWAGRRRRRCDSSRARSTSARRQEMRASLPCAWPSTTRREAKWNPLGPTCAGRRRPTRATRTFSLVRRRIGW